MEVENEGNVLWVFMYHIKLVGNLITTKYDREKIVIDIKRIYSI